MSVRTKEAATVSRASLPLPDWLRSYQSAWLRLDVVAGLTAAAIVIPKAMAYATIAGLPVQVAVNVTGTPGTGAALDDVTVHTGAPAAGCAAGMLAEQNAIGRATLPLPSST